MKTGIYLISNSDRGMGYIGSSQNIDKRWGQHKSFLNLDKHHCKALQAAWNYYGRSAFQLVVLELCEVTELAGLEQIYLNTANWATLYNTSRCTDSPMRGLKGHKWTEEEKKRLSEMFRGELNPMYGIKGDLHPSSKIRGQLHPGYGKPRPPESVAKRHRKYVVTSPGGEVFQVSGLRPFCVTHALNQGNLTKVAQGKRKTYKGWNCQYLD